MRTSIYLTSNPAGVILWMSGRAVHANDTTAAFTVRAIEHTKGVRPRTSFNKGPAVFLSISDRFTNMLASMLTHVVFRQTDQFLRLFYHKG